MSVLIAILDIITATVLTSLVGILLLRRFRPPQELVGVLTLAFALRFGYAVIDDHLEIFAGQNDFGHFNRLLWGIAQQWRVGETELFLQTLPIEKYVAVYAPVFSPIYIAFGHKTVLVRIAMAFVGALFVFNLYRITKFVSDHRSGLYAALFAAVFPYWIYLSGIFYRDMLVMLFLSQLLLEVLRWHHEERFLTKRLLILGLIVLFTGILRIENFVPIGTLLSVVVFFKLEEESLLATIVVSATSILVFISLFLQFSSNMISFNYLEKQRQYLTSEGGAYLEQFIYETPIELLQFLPIGALYFVLVPFPWQIHNHRSLLAFGQNIVFWYPALIFAVIGIRKVLKENGEAAAILLSYALVGIVSYGLVEGNMGPALRHRSQFQFVFIIFAAVALSKSYLADRIRASLTTLTSPSSKDSALFHPSDHNRR